MFLVCVGLPTVQFSNAGSGARSSGKEHATCLRMSKVVGIAAMLVGYHVGGRDEDGGVAHMVDKGMHAVNTWNAKKNGKEVVDLRMKVQTLKKILAVLL